MTDLGLTTDFCATSSYEKATLPDGKRGFVLIYAVCGERRPVVFRTVPVTFLIIKRPDYMRSGTSMPSSAMPFFSVLPTF